MAETRVELAENARAELTTRYRQSKEADRRLSDFLAGLVLALDIDPTHVAGYDDATGELLLAPPEDPPEAPDAPDKPEWDPRRPGLGY